MLRDKNILLGICGSIAAYKSALLVRLFVKAGANVQVIMTDAACDFITPLTLSTLSRNPVYHSFYKKENGEWNNHVELALWADHFIMAPASANTLAKMANGICDNLLMASYLSARCPVSIAPAMDLDMFKHQGTQSNLETLASWGHTIIHPENGELASGLFGEGRMAEPETIFEAIEREFMQSQMLKGKRVLITAGPTYEAIDPVRFIGNHSSGKMGYALAKQCAKLGAQIELISGPSKESAHHPNIHITRIVSANDMYEASIRLFPACDITIMSAAVADYTPVHTSEYKIKKQEGTLTIELTRTKDILKTLGEQKRSDQVLVGFALETDNEIEHASSKLKSKNADFIVLNSLKDKGAGFAHNTNKISILSKDGSIETFETKSKDWVAFDIVQKIISLIK